MRAYFAEWMAVEAELEPWPDGAVRWRHANGDVCRGQFVELVPHRRVVFTYGWERADVGIPPGSTTVEIDLDGGRRHHDATPHPSWAVGTGRGRAYDRLGALPGPARRTRRGRSTRGPIRGSTSGSQASNDRQGLGSRMTGGLNGAPVTRREMDPEERFWEMAEPLLLTRAGLTRSTMMGFPCLRVNGGFFASLDRKQGQLVVKLSEARVTELVTMGAAFPFAPAGRTFREWAAISPSASESWPGCSTKRWRPQLAAPTGVTGPEWIRSIACAGSPSRYPR